MMSKIIKKPKLTSSSVKYKGSSCVVCAPKHSFALVAKYLESLA
jgi:hypothetical protein